MRTEASQRRGTVPAIEVEGLRKVFPGGVEAVRVIDLRVDAGEVFSLLGPNGAGKSTTIGMLTSTITPSAGTARLAGFDVASEPLAARRISSVLFQDPVVDRPLTGRRNMEIHARLWGVDPTAAAGRIEQIVDAFGLAELIDRPVGTYSGGERRRLEIARALISGPQVLFLDEPTVGLDPRIRHELLDVIAGAREGTDMAILLTTHYLDEAERLSDRLAIMRAGEIVALGTPRELIDAFGREILEMRVGGGPEMALSRLRTAGIAGAEAFSIGSTLIVPLRDGATSDRAIGEIDRLGIATITLASRPPTLDDVYLSFTGDELAQAA